MLFRDCLDSFGIGTTSASFHAFGYVLDNRELFSMLVTGVKIQGSECRIMRILILSGPGDFLMRIDVIIPRILPSETATNLNGSEQGKTRLLMQAPTVNI